MEYIKKVKSRHVIRLLTTYVYQHCGYKIGLNVRAMFDQYYFTLPVLPNMLNNFFVWKFYNFTCIDYTGWRYSKDHKL